jgi:hypothetical protein
MSSAPIKKLPASPRVGSPSVPIADRGSEKVNVGFGDCGAGISNQFREPGLGRSASRSRIQPLESVPYWSPNIAHKGRYVLHSKPNKDSHICDFANLFGTTFCALFGISVPTSYPTDHKAFAASAKSIVTRSVFEAGGFAMALLAYLMLGVTPASLRLPYS